MKSSGCQCGATFPVIVLDAMLNPICQEFPLPLRIYPFAYLCRSIDHTANCFRSISTTSACTSRIPGRRFSCEPCTILGRSTYRCHEVADATGFSLIAVTVSAFSHRASLFAFITDFVSRLCVLLMNIERSTVITTALSA